MNQHRRPHIRALTLLCATLGLVSSAWAAQGSLSVQPAAEQQGRLTVVTEQKLHFRLHTDLASAQTATLNLTRSGRVIGEYAMHRDGADWVVDTTTPLPYAYVVTLRLYEDKRVWASATDLYSLERLDGGSVPPNSSAASDLEFVVTEGKPGGDTNPLWGIAALAVLFAGVFLGTRAFRRRPATVKTAKEAP